MTATRNQAIDAVVSKLSLVEGSILVFGREERLGPHAKRYQLEERVKRHPDVAAWEKHAARLEELRRAGGVRPATVVSALQAALVQVRYACALLAGICTVAGAGATTTSAFLAAHEQKSAPSAQHIKHPTQANGAPDEQLRKLRRDLEKLRQVQV